MRDTCKALQMPYHGLPSLRSVGHRAFFSNEIKHRSACHSVGHDRRYVLHSGNTTLIPLPLPRTYCCFEKMRLQARKISWCLRHFNPIASISVTSNVAETHRAVNTSSKFDGSSVAAVEPVLFYFKETASHQGTYHPRMEPSLRLGWYGTTYDRVLFVVRTLRPINL